MGLHELLIATAHAATPSAAPTPVVDLPTVDFWSSVTPETIANNIASLLLALAWPIGVAAIFYSAYQLVNSGGKPDAIEKVKKNIIYLISGLALIVFAVVLLRFFLGLFFGN